MAQTNVSLEVVEDVWNEYLKEFHSDDIVCDQIMIVSDKLLLRGPNYDLLLQAEQNVFIH